MIRYALKRIAWAVPTLFGVVAALFLLLHLAPGDPGASVGGGIGRGSREAVRATRRLYGLDRPLPAQFVEWLSRAARLDLGNSFEDHRPVAARISEALPYTLELNGLALLLTALVAVPLGVAQARRANSFFDRSTGGLLFVLYSMPSFWVAMLLLTLVSSRWPAFPLFGVSSDSPAGGAVAALADRARHIFLPLLCLTYGSLAFVARFVRSAVLEEMGKPYVLAARARGASQSRAVWRHAFRNALLPLITLLGLLLPGLISGSVIIERIFAWPGLGRLFFDAILSRDYPLILGLSLVGAGLTLASTLLADLLYAAADPRIRHER